MKFIAFYNHILKTTETYESLPFTVKTVHFKKGAIITNYDVIENAVYFINNGIVELSIKSYMSEKIIDFFFDNEMVSGLTSFLTQTPGDTKVTALLNCELEMITYHELMEAYETNFNVNRFGRILMEGAYIRKSNREKMLLTKTAEEIYAKMFETHPQYISHIPVNKIAKYLGIHPESLSRIRKKLNS